MDYSVQKTQEKEKKERAVTNFGSDTSKKRETKDGQRDLSILNYQNLCRKVIKNTNICTLG